MVNYSITPSLLPNEGTMFIDHEAAGRSGKRIRGGKYQGLGGNLRNVVYVALRYQLFALLLPVQYVGFQDRNLSFL